MTQKKTTKPDRIPEFSSIKEEADFWDTHSTADFEGEFKPVRVRFAQNLSEGLTVRLDRETLQKLRVMAKERGIGPTVMIRMWIMDRLKEKEPSR